MLCGEVALGSGFLLWGGNVALGSGFLLWGVDFCSGEWIFTLGMQMLLWGGNVALWRSCSGEWIFALGRQNLLWGCKCCSGEAIQSKFSIVKTPQSKFFILIMKDRVDKSHSYIAICFRK
ncbi:MAG TPA: hypothetical protein P5543_11790 [Planctomycetota bacterium]|nr:hypothetical protein [Planctomycetota bacterium]